jgi:hypothetical protein
MIIDILLGAVVPFVLIVVASYLILTHRSDEVMTWVKIAVKAAEQIFEHGDNKAKLDYVTSYISRKFKISPEDLEKLIESAVYELKE